MALAGAPETINRVINSHLMMAELVRRYGTDQQHKTLLAPFAAGGLPR
jgi:hypothetical protein